MTDAHWRELVERLPAVVYVSDFDENGTLRWISPRVQYLLGRAPEEFLADDELWYRCIHPEDVDRVRAEEARVHRDVEPFDCEYRMHTADEREIVVWERDAIVTSDDGESVWTQGLIIDVTELRAAERSAREDFARSQRHLDLAGTVIITLDASCRIQLLNRAGHEMLGLAPGEADGRNLVELAIPHEDRERVVANFARVFDGGEPVQSTIQRLVDGDGATHDLVWEITMLRDAQDAIKGVTLAGIDVTERRQAEARADFLAHNDALTGLPNRASLVAHLERALDAAGREGSAVALVAIDIDDFSLVNDSLGHDAGDLLLTQAAGRLRARRRLHDVVARAGSDEFFVVLGDLPAHAPDSAALAAPYEVEGTVFDVLASAGIAVYPDDADDAASLLRRAGVALHTAKAAGRGLVSRWEPTADEHRRPLSLGARLRRAIVGGDLLLHWQPIVDPATGILHTTEGLVRWDDGSGALLQPGAFVPFAEESGLIEALDDHVLALACEQMQAWSRAGVHPLVSVNVSPRALQSPGYPERVQRRLAEHGLDPSRLILELTESAAMREAERAAPLMNQLAGYGILLAIDDFGAGYSSLSRMLELRVDYLKVDRSLLRGVPESAPASAMVRTIVELARSLEMTAIVEGIETSEQQAFVAALPGALAQGYHLGRPGPADEIARRLRPPVVA